MPWVIRGELPTVTLPTLVLDASTDASAMLRATSMLVQPIISAVSRGVGTCAGFP